MCRAKQSRPCILCGARLRLWTAAYFTTTLSQVALARRGFPLRPQCSAASFLMRSASLQGDCETACTNGVSLQSCSSRNQFCIITPVQWALPDHLAWPSLSAAPVTLCLTSLHKPHRMHCAHLTDIVAEKRETLYCVCSCNVELHACTCLSSQT